MMLNFGKHGTTGILNGQAGSDNDYTLGQT